MSEDYNNNIQSGGITREQFLNKIKNKDEAFQNEALDIFTEYSNKISKNDDTLDAKEQELAKTAFQELGLELSTNTKKSEPTTKNMVSNFFQYITQDKEFTGSLANGQEMELPAGCTKKDNGIEFGGKLYVMRGGEGDDPLRFECDDTQKTLRQALSEANSDDAIHKYHNHGDAVNDKSTYNKESGTISHDNDETAVSQTQTFASMLMNGAKASRLTLDEQKSKNGNTTTTGETILNTINTDNDDGITMKELMSYLNAVQQESKTVKNPTGARKFAKGVDLDAKDLSNISKVFKKYAGNDNKLQKEELQKLLNDLKTKSMSELATGDDDKYIGEKDNNDDKIEPNSTPKPKKEPEIRNNGNRTRKVRQDVKTEGYGEKQKYDYHNGVRTALVPKKDNKLYEDENGNLAQVGHSSLFKKRFEYIEGLPKEVRAKVIDGKIDKNDYDIVQVKDKAGETTYYNIVQSNNHYKLGTQLIKKNDKFVPKSRAEDLLKNQLNLPNDVEIPKNFTLYYDKNNKIKIKENGKKIDDKSYIRRKIAEYTKNKNTRLSYDSSTEIYKRNFKRKLTSSEREIMEAKAEKEGYKPTDGAEYGWYKKYDNKKTLRHFLWNPKTETFDMKKKVSFVTDKGEALNK